MADGSIQFDTAVNTDGVIAGLQSLAKNAEDAAKQVSNALDGGILGGIENIGVAAMASMQALSGAAGAAARQMIALGTLTEEESTKIRQSAQETYFKNLQKQSQDKKDMQDREFRYLKNSLQLGLISEDNYYRQLAVLRDRYFAQGSDGWERYTMDILEYNQKMVTEQKKLICGIFKEMSAEIADNAEEIQKTQDKMEEKLSEFGGLYDDVSYRAGGQKGSFMRLHDIEGDISILKAYNDALSSLKMRVDKLWTTDGSAEGEAQKNAAARKAFFSEIRDMSVIEGLNFADYFLQRPDMEINNYLQAWAQKQDLSKAIAQNLYGEESQEFFDQSVSNMAEQMLTQLKEKFGELPDDFFDEGVASALGFGQGFLNALDEVFVRLKTEVAARAADLTANINGMGTQNTQNISNYTIYGAESPYKTAMQIEKQETMKRMLAGG